MKPLRLLRNVFVLKNQPSLNHDLASSQILQNEALLNEYCIIVNESDHVLGCKSKKECHLMENINKGLLHRAFSILLFNSKKEFLITQRSETKVTFPNCYTNACCSHPLFNSLEKEEKNGLGVKRAAHRRLCLELGVHPNAININDIQYITRMLYKFPSNCGSWGEHELDYLLVIHKDIDIKPSREEIRHAEYISRDQFTNHISKLFVTIYSCKSILILLFCSLSFLVDTWLDTLEKKGEHISPWFKLICKHFLYDFWDNLDNLDKCVDHKTIHIFT